MLEIVNYVQAEFPDYGSQYMADFAQRLYEEYRYFRSARADLEQNIWPACDDAYMCIRQLPDAEGMDWADDSDMGETDIWDSINFLSDSLCLSLLPRDESAFQVLSADPEDQGLLNDLRDLIASLCRKCDLRGQYAKHIKQALIRGTSGIWTRWKRKTRLRRKTLAETIAMLAEQGVDTSMLDTRALKNIRFPEITFNAPVVTPVDMYNLLLDPNADLHNDEDLPMIVVTYKTLDELRRTEDVNGERIYPESVLKDLKPMSAEQIRNENAQRYQTMETIGINTLAEGAKDVAYVPVLIFHRQYREFKGKEFNDCYFHLALNSLSGGDGAKIIRAEINPDPTGSRCVYVDTYQDWIGNTAYGVGAVEKSLQAYTHKNVISALTFNAQLASVFPARVVIGGLLQDDTSLKLGPGSITTIPYKPGIGTNFISSMPGPEGGVQLGMMDQQFLGQKILGQMGGYGAIMQDPTKTVTRAKTATQINTESTSGSVIRDNLLERMTIRTLEPIIQYIYDSAQLYLEEAQIEFEKGGNGDISMGKLAREDLNKNRRIVVTGWHGLFNKAQEVEQLKEALAVLTQGNALEVMPQLTPVLQEVVFRLLGRLGVKNLEDYKQDPIQLLMQNPQIQAQINGMLEQARQQGMQMAMSGELADSGELAMMEQGEDIGEQQVA